METSFLDIVNIAKSYAIRAHSSTNHLYDGQPYEVHLQMVYDFGLKYSHLLPDDKTISNVLAACWAHDVIEDCRETYNDVRKVLGYDVAEIVYALTNEKGRNRKERANDKYYEGIKNTPFATFVKLCDRLANVSYSRSKGSNMLNGYIKEYGGFQQHLWCIAYQEMFEEISSYFVYPTNHSTGS